MHDFLLAKEIVDAALAAAEENKLGSVKSVSLEIGGASVPHNHHHDHDHAHDGHFDELDMENVRFGIESVAKGTVLEKAEFKIKRVDGSSWKITEMEV